MSSNGRESERSESLPYSCQCVLLVLEAEGALTRQDLLEHEKIDMPERTLSRVLKTLENGGYISLDQHPRDLREVVATLA